MARADMSFSWARSSLGQYKSMGSNQRRASLLPIHPQGTDPRSSLHPWMFICCSSEPRFSRFSAKYLV